MSIYDRNNNLAIFKFGFENVCRQYAGKHFCNIIGNIAEMAEGNFAFRFGFLLKLSDQLSEKSKIPFVNLLSRQNLDFFGKEKYFSIFKIFLT